LALSSPEKSHLELVGMSGERISHDAAAHPAPLDELATQDVSRQRLSAYRDCNVAAPG
jgi:hypothetical protein